MGAALREKLMLTDGQRAAYDRDGFIVVPDVFPAEDIAELRRVTDEFVSASATVTANDSVYDLEDTHSAGRAPGAPAEGTTCDPPGLHARQPPPQNR